MGKRVIIFTNENSAGVATALKEQIMQSLPDSAVLIMDEMDLRSRAVGDFAEKVFHVKLNFAKNRAQIAERYYARFMDSAPNADDDFKPNATSYRAMYKIMQKYEPELIVTIGYGAINEAVATRKYTSAQCKIVCVVADYTLHKCLVNPFIDGYVVCAESVKEVLIAYGIPDKKIVLADIPVEKKYLRASPAEISDRVRLGGKPTLLYVPTENAEHAEERIKELAEITEANILLYAGTDREVFRQGIESRLYTFNEGTSVPLLVANADIILIPPEAYIAETCLRLGKTVFLSETSSAMAKRNATFLRRYTVDCEAVGSTRRALAAYLSGEIKVNKKQPVSDTDSAVKVLRLAGLV